MRRPNTSRLASMVFGVVALMYVTELGLLSLLFAAGGTDGGIDAIVLVMLAFPVVGAPVAARQPRNAAGWLLLAIGGAWGLGGVVTPYARYGLETNPASLPGPDLVLALVSW